MISLEVAPTLLPGDLEDVTLEYLEGASDVEIPLDVTSVFTYSDTS